MLRAAVFCKEFNGHKGTRFVLADFFTNDEVRRFKQQFLEPNGRPIRSVGDTAYGSYGDEDEVEGNASILFYR